jgi:hypothetical protein
MSVTTSSKDVMFLFYSRVRISFEVVRPHRRSEGDDKQLLNRAQNMIRGYIQKFPDWVDNEINNNNKRSLKSNIKGYDGKTHQTDSQNSDTTAPKGRELYHLQFSLQEANPET